MAFSRFRRNEGVILSECVARWRCIRITHIAVPCIPSIAPPITADSVNATNTAILAAAKSAGAGNA